MRARSWFGLFVVTAVTWGATVASPAARAVTHAPSGAPDDAALVGALPGDWPAAGRGPHQQSTNWSESTITPENVGSLTTRWHWSAPSRAIPEQVITARGTVYVASQTNSASVTALDESTGTVRWNRKAPYASTLAYSAGQLIVIYGRGIIALDPATGSERWRLQGAFVDRALVVPNMLVLAEESRGGMGPATIVGIAPADGHELWRRTLGGLSSVATLAWWHDVVYAAVGYGSVALSALDARTGQVLWSQPSFAGSYATGVTVTDTNVFVTVQPGDSQTTNEVHSFRRSDGLPGWSALPVFTHFHVPAAAFSDRTLFLADNGDDGTVTAFAAKTGTVRWSATNRPEEIAVANGVVFVSAVTGLTYSLIALDARDGSPRWSQALADDDFPSDIVVSHGALIVATGKGVTAFSPGT